MSRFQRRALVMGLAAVLLCAATVVVVNRYVLEQEWWQADHTTTSAAPGALLRSGPPAGPLGETWQLRTPVHATVLPQLDQVSYGFVDHQIVVASARGLAVHDARTGGPRWHYYRSGWSLLGWSGAGHELVGYFERYGDRGTHVMIGFDAGSGRELWRSTALAPPVVDQAQPRWPARRSASLVARDRHTWAGVDPRTGRTVWSRKLPSGCALPGIASNAATGDADVAVLAADCRVHGRSRTRVLAIDPATGHPLWHKRYRAASGVAVDTHDGVTEIWDGHELRIVDAHGRELLSRTGSEVCGSDLCPFTVAQGRVVVAYRDGVRRLAIVDGGNGRVHRDRRSARVDRLATDGRHVYALRAKLSESLMPAGVEVIDPVSGHARTVPLPFTYRGETMPWMATGGGLLYIGYPVPTLGELGGMRLTALRAMPSGPGPDALGGVRTKIWPDACDLLTGADLKAVFGAAAYTRRPTRAAVDGAAPKHAVGCTYATKGDGGPEVSVTVRWVSQTRDEARTLLTTVQTGYKAAKRLPHVADQAYDLGSLSGEVDLRVGRFVLAVDVGRDSGGTATRLARRLAVRMREARAERIREQASPSPSRTVPPPVSAG